jgi:hypothetical protein|tara:strand:+ start:493 stop:858 length:366 start_codon:yes stop_codon:yes gene_type:complete
VTKRVEPVCGCDPDIIEEMADIIEEMTGIMDQRRGNPCAIGKCHAMALALMEASLDLCVNSARATGVEPTDPEFAQKLGDTISELLGTAIVGLPGGARFMFGMHRKGAVTLGDGSDETTVH